MVGVGALAASPSLLPLILGTGNANSQSSADFPFDPATTLATDLFAQVIANSAQEGNQVQSLVTNVTAAHTLLGAAQPLLPGLSSVFGTGFNPPAGQVEAQAKTLVDALNQVLGTGTQAQSLSTITNFLSTQSSALAQIGITQDPAGSGQLTLDVTKLNAALSSNPASVEQLLGGGGLAGVVTSGANDLLGQSLGFTGPVPQGASLFRLLATTPGLLVDLLA